MPKSKLSEAAEAVKQVAGTALGAAAVAATGVVVTKVASAIRKGGQELEESTPKLQRLAANTVTKPLLPKNRKHSRAKQRAKSAKRSTAGRKAGTKRRARARG
jgi:hypothetical protein